MGLYLLGKASSVPLQAFYKERRRHSRSWVFPFCNSRCCGFVLMPADWRSSWKRASRVETCRWSVVGD